MPDNKETVENKELTIELGDNLLVAIGLVLKSVEKENKYHFWRRIRPGKEVQLAFGIDLSNAYRYNVRPNLSRKLT